MRVVGFFVPCEILLTGLFSFAEARTFLRKETRLEALILLLLKIVSDVVWYFIRKRLDRNDKQS